MTPDIDVDADELRRCASAVAETAALLATGPDRSPRPVTAPGWAVTAAADTMGAAADRRFGALGAAVSSTGRHLSSAAAGYEAADERAVGRLRRMSTS